VADLAKCVRYVNHWSGNHGQDRPKEVSYPVVKLCPQNSINQLLSYLLRS